MECAFICFQARKSVSTSSLAVAVFALMWLSGLRVAFIHSPIPARLVLVLMAVACMAPINLGAAAYLRWHARTSAECLRHERIKALTALIASTVAMACVLLQRPGDMGTAGAPICVATIHAWMVPFYQVRVATARPLHMLLYLNFVFMMVGRWCLLARISASPPPFAWPLLPTGLLTSVVAPLALGGVLEAGSRAAFLREFTARTGSQPLPELGPVWQRVLPCLGTQQGLMRASLAFW
ncbi:hypothetical protein WJX72_000084 [[Myrmecia] bisecta]|uniref:Uncharacterized protein n=1 Tax=[Myrmecia] bisecta TaxID=41462 RepID=A0AAW1PAL3_9CHLO